MTYFGSPEQWIGFIDSKVPDILALVIETWESMPTPAGNALEDSVSVALCRALRQSRNRSDLPFRIDTQLVELDPAAGQDQGRMDIVFSPPVPREDIYFCLECKRINVRGEGPIRPYFVEYVRFGMFRFIRGQYANSVRYGGMLAFVLNADLASAIDGVESNVQKLHAELGMDATVAFQTSTIRPTDPRVRETWHRRTSHSDPFVIHHLFMAGDPNVPLLPEPPPDWDSKPMKTKKKSTTRRPASNRPDESQR